MVTLLEFVVIINDCVRATNNWTDAKAIEMSHTQIIASLPFLCVTRFLRGLFIA